MDKIDVRLYDPEENYRTFILLYDSILDVPVLDRSQIGEIDKMYNSLIEKKFLTDDLIEERIRSGDDFSELVIIKATLTAHIMHLDMLANRLLFTYQANPPTVGKKLVEGDSEVFNGNIILSRELKPVT